MKPIIFRKPKCMRSDIAMASYMFIAETASKLACSSDNVDEQVKYLQKAGECFNKAAKAGGFFRTKDFIRWLDAQK